MAVLAGAGVAAGAALQSATGFGFSLIAAPLVFATLEPAEAVGLLTLLGTEVNLLTLLGERRRPQPVWRESLLIVGAAIPGAIAGVALLRALDPVALQIAVSVGVVATLVARRLAAGRTTPIWAAPIAGFTAGGLTTSTTTSGPPMLVYLLGRALTPAQLRDTMPVCFLGLSVVGALALLVTRTHGAVPDATLVAVLVPVVAVSHVAGRPLFTALERSESYEQVVTALLLVSLVVGLATAVL
jgi:uncharacterized membrane protein YfcA